MKLSFSAISTWLTCPKQFYECNLMRNWSSDNEAARAGTIIHGEIEDYLKGKREALPTRVPQDDLLSTLRNVPILVEHKFAVNREGRAVDYNADDVILRGKMDVVVPLPDAVWTIDWKTGKIKDNTLQGGVYGVMLAAHYPGQTVKASFDYLEKGRTQPIVHTAAAARRVWDLVNDVESDSEFRCKPSGLCGWCPVRTCKHWRER